MRCFRRHRIERGTSKGHVLRRRSDGTLWTEGHAGYGAAIAAAFGGGNKYCFSRVRRWRHRWVVSRNIVWEHDDASAFEFYFSDMKRKRMVQLGKLPQ